MWSKKYKKCKTCNLTKNKHKGNGLCVNCYARERRKNNPEKFRNKDRQRRKDNPEKFKKRQKNFREINPDKVREYNRKYRKNNPDKVNGAAREWWKKRVTSNIHFKLKKNISALISNKLKRHLLSKSNKSTFSFLPYTTDQLKIHLERQFKLGMTWSNYGKWHIDHKVPDCSFKYTSVNDEEFQKCWSLENLQPLWAEENLRKSGKIIKQTYDK